MEQQDIRGSGRSNEGIVLAILLVGVVVLGLWTFLQRDHWFPPLASQHGADLDRLFMITLSITGSTFIILLLILGYILVRFRERGGGRAETRVNRAFELRFALVAGVFVFLVDVGLSVLSEGVWFQIHASDSQPNEYTVEATGEQFMWQFRYPGPDGTFGATSPALATATNPVGLDMRDAAAQDDKVITNNLHLPVGRPARIRLRSKDVIHCFFLPDFRVKQDVVPGMLIDVRFVPTREGDYEVVCNQLCGLGHYKMKAFLKVESEEALARWLNEQGV